MSKQKEKSRFERFRDWTRWERHKFKDWYATHFHTKLSTVSTPYGFPLKSRGFIANRMMQEGTFEPEETAIALEAFARSQVFIDIGANIGYYVCMAALRGVEVVAFEPQSQNLTILYENSQLNNLRSVEVIPVALSSEIGLVDLYGSSGPSASLLRNWAGYRPAYHQTVPATTLDRMVGSRLFGRQAFIKIDVEGFEFSVLKGGSSVLKNDPKPSWMIEICLEEFHPSGLNPDYEKTFALFFDAGYRAFTADRRKIEICRADVLAWIEAKHCPLNTFNFLFTA